MAAIVADGQAGSVSKPCYAIMPALFRQEIPMKLDIPRFDKASILVVGDVMLDRYWHGGTSRISPEAPVPVVHVNQNEDW